MTTPIVDIVAQTPSEQDRDAVQMALRQFNRAQTAWTSQGEFAVLLRDPQTGEVTGGLYGEESYGWAFVRYLVVPQAYRGQGLGSRLIAEAETIARARGYVGIWLDTYDFQARPFYEKLGYRVFGELESGPRARGQFFLKKVF